MSRKKFESNNRLLIIKMLLLNLLSSAALIVSLIAVVSLVVLKLDIPNEYAYYMSFGMIALGTFLNGFIFGKLVQTNKILVGILSNVLFMLFLIISNIFVTENRNIFLFILKLIICVAFGAIGGITSIKRKRKFKV